MLPFFIFLLSLAPFVSTKATGSCQGTECPPKTWHNVGCSTDDDCDAPYVRCYKRVCRCEPGYFYTTHDTCTNTCSPDDMQDSFTDYPDSALRANLIHSEDRLTVEDCKDRCQTNKTCLTFDFKASGGLCRLHNVTSRHSNSDWSPKHSKGWTHYQKSCKSTFASNDNWHNLLCRSRIDCPDTNSDCLSGRCLCRPGFKFNEAEKKCVVASDWRNKNCSTDNHCDVHHAECFKRKCRCEPGYFYTTHDTCTSTCSPDDMQDSFTEYPDSALRENLIGSEDGLTVEDCKDRCQTDKRCLTFDFKASGGLCRLHNVTAHESPSNWYPKTSKGWTHYQKSCKSTFASNDIWYNLLCNNKIDCHHPHSDCLSGRCLCHSGFHFNESQKKCVVTSELKKWHNTSCSTDDDCDAPHAECYKRVCRCEPGYFYTTQDTCTNTCSPDDMQDSFTDYPDSALRENLIDRRDGLTVEACKDRCQTDKRCLTFDFKASGGLCRLHNVTSRQSHSDWYPKTSKGWTHYQKSCKSTFASNDIWYNLLCNNKIDCHHPHSDCLSGRCLCRSGLHFNQAQKECVFPRKCEDLVGTGAKSGVYYVDGLWSVWCDMDTAGGGWTVIQRRRDFTVDFNRSWTEYDKGFGNLSGDFWLGLSKIYGLARNGLGARLRVELVAESGTELWAEYSTFYIDNRRTIEYYEVYVSGYSGTAGDGLTASSGQPFITYDWYDCVTSSKGAWWYPPDCASRANLFSPDKRHMTWADISRLQFSEMKIKR